jgi:uncharacterized membrane protein
MRHVSAARDPLDAPARHENVAAVGLGGRALERALDVVTEGPDRATWALVLDRTLLVAGALLVVSGVVCFFAWNWADLHRFAKLGLVAAGIAAGGGGALALGLDRPAGKVALSVAAALVGVLLAVFGQVYQTGADAWELFRGWALLALPFALAGRFAPLWALWLLVANVWIATWCGAAGIAEESAGWWFAAANGAAWAGWEALSTRVDWMRGRALPRILSLPTFGALLLPSIAWATSRHSETGAFVLALAAACAVAAAVFVRVRRDVFVVAIAAGAAIAFATSWSGHALIDAYEEWGAVLTGLLLVGEIAAAVRWLGALARRPE